MNLRNAEQAARLFGGDLRRNAGGVLTLRLADGDQFVFASPPIDVTSDKPEPGDENKEPGLRRYVEADVAGAQANRVMWSLAKLSQDRQRVGRDARLTEAGRKDALREGVGVALANAADAWAKLDEYYVGLVEREHALFAVPVIERGDAVAALLDREVREWVRGLAGEERANVLSQLTRGEAEGVTLALLRSPVPIGNLETVARHAWRSAVERRHPQEVELLAQQHEHLRAMKLLAQRAAAKIAEKSGLAGYELFAQAAQFTPAMPNGPSIFFTDPAELRAHRTRWQAMQARAA